MLPLQLRLAKQFREPQGRKRAAQLAVQFLKAAHTKIWKASEARIYLFIYFIRFGRHPTLSRLWAANKDGETGAPFTQREQSASLPLSSPLNSSLASLQLMTLISILKVLGPRGSSPSQVAAPPSLLWSIPPVSPDNGKGTAEWL